MSNNNNQNQSQSLIPAPPQQVKRLRRKKLKKLPISLTRTKAYIKQLSNMKPEECYKLQMDQLDALILSNKECAISALERIQEGDHTAIDEYKHYIACGGILAQDKVRLAEFYATAFPNLGKEQPKPYVAPQLSKEEWEAQFKPKDTPTTPPQKDRDLTKDSFIAPAGDLKSVN